MPLSRCLDALSRAHQGRGNPALRLVDLLVVAALMFGYFIVLSVQAIQQPVTVAPAYTADADLFGFLQILPLALSGLYLAVARGFSLSRLPWGVGLKTSLLGCAVFLLLAVYTDAVYALLQRLSPPVSAAADAGGDYWPATPLGIALRAGYSVLNGIYEEVFFLGIVLAVKRKWLPLALVLSLVVRCSLHLYQGWQPALFNIFYGVAMLCLMARLKCLWPMMIAHMLVDVWGPGLWFIHILLGTEP